jgi:hypothetical protein
MKLRIRGDSIRFRLGQSEVRKLVDQGSVEERTTFAPGVALAYRLELGDASARGVIHATLSGSDVVVRLPRDAVLGWSASDDVALAADQSAGPGRTLRILIEKDFACLDASADEPQDDAFPNPLASTTSC